MLTTFSAIVLLLGLVVLTGTFVRNFNKEVGIRTQTRQVRAELDRLEIEQKRIDDALAQPRAAEIVDRTEFLNSLIRQKGVSWTRIFMDLEKIMPDRVQAASLRPVVKAPGTSQAGLTPEGDLQMQLQMAVSSESVTNLVELLHRMEQSKNFRLPVLGVESQDSPIGGPNALNPNSKGLVNLTLSVNYAQ